MINAHQLLDGLFMGSFIIALGLFPRIFQTPEEPVIAFSNQVLY
jgi:hypothetical protein